MFFWIYRIFDAFEMEETRNPYFERKVEKIEKCITFQLNQFVENFDEVLHMVFIHDFLLEIKINV